MRELGDACVVLEIYNVLLLFLLQDIIIVAVCLVAGNGPMLAGCLERDKT